jgi:acyl-CoA dehydrogenase
VLCVSFLAALGLLLAACDQFALTSARAALEIFAGRGCQRDHHIERYLRDVIHTFPAAGTSDVQRLRLAEVALGQYRGDWSGRLGQMERDRERLREAA